jgi:hypothetical protein
VLSSMALGPHDLVDAVQTHWQAGAAFTCVVIVVLLIRASSKRSNQSQDGPTGFKLKVELNRAHRVLLSQQDFGSAPSDESLAIADKQLRVNVPWTAALSRETMSDLLRTITANTGSVFFTQRSSSSPDMQQHASGLHLDPYVSAATSADTHAVLEEFEKRLVREIGPEAWAKLDVLDSNTQCNRAHVVLQRVAWFLTIAPSLTVVMQTGLLPGLFQPTFVIVVGAPEDASDGPPVVRVMVDAFIGGPPLGPPNPRLKYTPLRLRMLSSDLAQFVVGQETAGDSANASVELPSISYAIRRTKSKSMFETVTESAGALHAALAEGAAWQTVVVA